MRGIIREPRVAREVARLLEPVHGASEVARHLGADSNAHGVREPSVVAGDRIHHTPIRQRLERRDGVTGPPFFQCLIGLREEGRRIVLRPCGGGAREEGEERDDEGQRSHRFSS